MRDERSPLIGPVGRSASRQRRHSCGDVAGLGVVTCLRDATELLREKSHATSRVEFLRSRRAELEERGSN